MKTETQLKLSLQLAFGLNGAPRFSIPATSPAGLSWPSQQPITLVIQLLDRSNLDAQQARLNLDDLGIEFMVSVEHVEVR